MRQYIPISPYRDKEITKKESCEQFFFKRRYETIKEVLDENKSPTVFELYIFECLITCLWKRDRIK